MTENSVYKILIVKISVPMLAALGRDADHRGVSRCPFRDGGDVRGLDVKRP
jgi:hypothetical protein